MNFKNNVTIIDDRPAREKIMEANKDAKRRYLINFIRETNFTSIDTLTIQQVAILLGYRDRI